MNEGSFLQIFDLNFSFAVRLQYPVDPFVLRNICTKDADILEVRKIEFSIKSMWSESF